MESNTLLNVNEIIVNEDNDFWLIQGECPYCHGLFAIDGTYFEQVDNVIHCPMCCMEVVIPENEED